MNIVDIIIDKILNFENKDSKIGLSQFKPESETKKKPEPSIRKKDVKLSDLMRRAS